MNKLPSVSRKQAGAIRSRHWTWVVIFSLALSYFIVQYRLIELPVSAPSMASSPISVTNGQPVLSAEREPPKVEPTRPKLLLVGIVATPADRFALIRTDDGTGILYAVGQDIVAGVRLQEVFPNRALVRFPWGHENLLLQGPTSDTTSSVDNKQETETSGLPTSANAPTPQQRPNPARQALMLPSPGGGLIVKKTRPGSVYREIGLRAGDVITSVNGQPVNSIDEIETIYQQVQENKASTITMMIRRANENIILNK